MNLNTIKPQPIVTFDGANCECLHQKTSFLKENELHLAADITEKLLVTLKQFNPVAGLAAPQIGISKAVFIYTYDRNPDHLVAVINPTFEPIGDERLEGWEACLSSIFSQRIFVAAKIPRYKVIKVSHLNLKGETVSQILDGFAAKVFQHEMDHINGVGCHEHPEALVKKFESVGELKEFMKAAHQDDQAHYNKPKEA